MTNSLKPEEVNQLVEKHGEDDAIGSSLVPVALHAQGIDTVISLQGGQIMPTHDRTSRLLKQVFFKTEQGVAFGLIGMAKVTQRPQVGIVKIGRAHV